MYIIRKAVNEDLSTIVNIYNQVIADGGYSADLAPYTGDEKRTWFTPTNQPRLGISLLVSNIYQPLLVDNFGELFHQ